MEGRTEGPRGAEADPLAGNHRTVPRRVIFADRRQQRALGNEQMLWRTRNQENGLAQIGLMFGLFNSFAPIFPLGGMPCWSSSLPFFARIAFSPTKLVVSRESGRHCSVANSRGFTLIEIMRSWWSSRHPQPPWWYTG